jgi:hypothetical protein
MSVHHPRTLLRASAFAAVSLGLALAPVVAHAQFPAAGSYANSFTSVQFQTGSPSDSSQPFVSISLQGNSNTAMPQGGTRTTTSSLQLNYTIQELLPDSSFLFAGGCVLIDPTNLTISQGLKSATLKTTVDLSTPTCGFAENGPLPGTIVASWIESTPVLSLTGDDRFACAGYTKETRTVGSSDGTNATAAIQLLAASFTAQQSSIFQQVQNSFAQGAVPPDTCAQSIGRGAFGGFPAAGDYRQTTIEADAELFPTDPSVPQVFVVLKRIVSTSSPLGGATTTTNETDLSLFVQSDTLQVSGCFVIDPASFTINSDLTSAALQTTVTDQNQGCQPNNNVSAALGVNVSWSGPGPISTLSGAGQIACAQYHDVSSSAQTINGSPAVNVTLSDPVTGTIIAGPLPAQGALGSLVSRTTAAGVLGPNCGFHF